MTRPWRKSSHSSDSANCVEIRTGNPVEVRDSKDADGPTLAFAAAAWTGLLADLRDGRIGRDRG